MSDLPLGRHLGIPAHEYHAEPALGSTDIRRAALHSVAHARMPTTQTPAMARGSRHHAAVLEPELFDDLYAVPDDHGQCNAVTAKGPQCKKPAVLGATTCATHGGRDEAEEWVASLPAGTEVITAEEREEALEAARRIQEGVSRLDDPYRRILDGGDREVTYRAVAIPLAAGWTMSMDADPNDGLLIHARVDIDHHGRGVIADLKGMMQLPMTEHAMVQHVTRMGMQIQASLYHWIVQTYTGERLTWSWLCHESAPPYGVRLYDIGESDLVACRLLVERGLDRWLEAQIHDEGWAGWPTRPTTIRLPPWATGEEE